MVEGVCVPVVVDTGAEVSIPPPVSILQTVSPHQCNRYHLKPGRFVVWKEHLLE